MPDPARRARPDWSVAVGRYAEQHRTIPNLIRPKTFNEKILHRIVFGREPWMAMVADEYRVRYHVRERVGEHVPPTLFHVTTDPDTIPFEALPDRFVVKPTHGSGWSISSGTRAAWTRPGCGGPAGRGRARAATR